jgi:cytochrome c oxidase assembly protein subunit 15
MLAKITVAVIFLLLVWGNIVAGLKAGLACPDWPLCHGEVVPPFRWDIYIEFFHRLLGATAGLLLIILSYKRFREYPGLTKFIPVLTVALLIFQITLGGIVVLMKLPVDITTFHFGTALLLFTLTLYLAYFDGKINVPSFSLSNFGWLFFSLALLIFVQAVLGAYVRHTDAGLACPDFPKCLGHWIPPVLRGIVLTHYIHRSVAYLIFIVVFSIFIYSFINNRLRHFRSKIIVLVVLIFLQILVGVGVVHSKLFFAVTAIHISLALLILGTVLYTWFQDIKESYAS